MYSIVFSNILIMLIYILIGFVICKLNKGIASHAKTLSGILVYVLNPCMIISSFLHTEYNLETLKQIGLFFVVSLAIQALVMFSMWILFHKKYEDAKYRILTASGVLGNVGFFGLPVVTSLFPDKPIVACYCMALVLSMNILTFTMGIYALTNDKKYMRPKNAFLNPATIGLIIALPLFIFGVKLPSFLTTPIDLLGKMVTPFCMFILGMRLSITKLKSLFDKPFVYWTCLVKLIVYPLITFGIVYFLPFLPYEFKATLFILCAAPSASIVVSLAEIHNCEQELSSSIVLFSSIICIITLPLLSLLLSL